MKFRKMLPGLWALMMLSVGGVAWACNGPTTGPNCQGGICCVANRETGEMTCSSCHVN